MKVKSVAWLIAIIGVQASVFAFTRASEVSVRQATRLNLNWKFYKGTPAGNPFDNAYADASWTTVCIPHSIDYTEPTQAAEQASYKGVAWYRHPIQVAGGTEKKYFLEFEGAMQTVDVYVNGTKAGTHDNSGYTGFSYDISGQMAGAASAACAVRLDNTRNADIPPGRTGTAPDFYLFSGLYRNVWLVTTGKVYIPFCGQFITTPTATASSGMVNVKTTVKNETAAAVTCAVAISIRNRSNQQIAAKTATASISAGGSNVFDITSDAIANPQLWSPEQPNLYRVYTTISVGGAIVDDYSATFGFRTLSWSSANGFSLNGSRYHIEGVCEHQSIAWVQNAVPDTRWPVEMAMIKDAGYNAIRCSHYPRSPAFYNAADSLGILLMVEIPTWGYGQSSYSSAFWTRLENCAREMVSQGYNHPSIFLWGLFNEPFANFSTNLTTINTTIHSLDNARATITATNILLGQESVPDVIGLNYSTISSFGAPNSGTRKFVTTEYFEGWNYNCARGADCEAQWSDDGWNAYQVANNQPQQHAGQFLWVYNDYTAGKPMGIVDEYRLPKNLYYRFRQAFTSKAPDYAVAGAAAKIDLKADLVKLQADGADITIVSAALRNASNACINSTANVTFGVTGPATAFGPLTRAAAGGKVAIVLKSTTTAGTVTVTANSGSLPQAQLSIASEAVITTPVIKSKGVVPGCAEQRLSLRMHGNTIGVGSVDMTPDRIVAVDIHGRTLGVWNNTASVNIGTSRYARGICVVKAEKGGLSATGRMTRLAD